MTRTYNFAIGNANKTQQVVDPEYQEKWDNYAKLFARTPVGKSKFLRGRLYEIRGIVPDKPFTFNGKTTLKDAFELKFELREKGMEGLRFWLDITVPKEGNPIDPRSYLYSLITSVTGVAPDETESFILNPHELTRRDIMLEIRKGPVNRPKDDGTPNPKRGGFYSKIVDFTVVDDDPMPEYDDGGMFVEVTPASVQSDKLDDSKLPVERSDIEDDDNGDDKFDF
jgi:hypothetical protein